MKQVSYKCDSCNEIIKISLKDEEKPTMTFICPICKQNAKRIFSVNLSKEDDTVSAAIQTMLFSKNPSQKTKTVI